jgi:transporter family protein
MPIASWQVWALASAFFAGLTAILAKVGVRDMDSNLATAVRTAVVLVLAASIVAWQKSYKTLPELDSRSVIFLALSGLATGASWLCYFHALKIGPASRVAPIDKLSVVFVVILAAIFLGEAFTWKIALGVLLMVAGAIIVAL